MSYLFFALLAALLYAFSGISGKIATKHKVKNLPALLFWSNITALIFVPLLWLKSGHIQTQFNPAFFLFVIVFSIASLLTWKVLYKLDVSVYQSLFNTQTIFVTVLAFFLLGEKFPIITYMAIGLAVVGCLMVSYNENEKVKSFLNKNTLVMFLAIIFYALSDILVKKSLTEGLDLWNFKAWSLIAFALVFSPCYFLAKKEIKISVNQLSPLFFNNLFLVLAHLAVYYAFLTNVTISQTLAMFGSFFTLLITAFGSALFPNWLEQHPVKVYIIRTLGSILIIASAIVIVLS